MAYWLEWKLAGLIMLTNAASMGTLCLGLPDWWPVNSCGGRGGERKSEREREGGKGRGSYM